jgi:hypothetical protein
MIKPKSNYKANVYQPSPLDLCGTPPHALEPLIPFLSEDMDGVNLPIIWEPANGKGLLSNALFVAGFHVEVSDINTGQNFFEYEPAKWDILVTNPPYGIKYNWIERCYELGKPFALLVPLETIGAYGAIKHAQLFGAELMILYPRVSFKMPEAGWFSSAQFPTMWFCNGILPEKLMYAEVFPPPRSEVRVVTRNGKQITQHGYPDWIEDPSYYAWLDKRFVYDQVLDSSNHVINLFQYLFQEEYPDAPIQLVANP